MNEALKAIRCMEAIAVALTELNDYRSQRCVIAWVRESLESGNFLKDHEGKEDQEGKDTEQ